MKQKFHILLFSVAFILILPLNLFSQNTKNLWEKISAQNVDRSELVIRKSEPVKSDFYNLDLSSLKQVLVSAPERRDNPGSAGITVAFPNVNGLFETYLVKEASIMHPDLQAKFPDSRSYVGSSIDNPGTSIRFSVTQQGLHLMRLSATEKTQYIDPYNGSNAYVVYSKENLPLSEDLLICNVIDEIESTIDYSGLNAFRNANDGQMREFRLAVATTIEYSEFHWMAAGLTAGATEAAKKAAVSAEITVVMTRVNGIYEKELSITMMLIPNNDDLIFIDSDSYTNSSGGAMLSENQSVIDTAIGSANYDIGHVFSTGGGGVAYLGSVCTSIKAGGVTGLGSPVGDPFYVDYVSHEMGHQFGANHPFNGSTGSCSGGNRNASTAYEPGSGTTIMAYAGICTPQNVQLSSDDYFHQVSLFEIWNNVTTGNSTCANQTPTGNSAPTAEAGASHTIPISTPYKLTGSSTDTDGTASHTFTWEQYDLGPAGVPSETTATGPMVRSFKGTTNPTRYIPQLSDLINSGGSMEWERLASVSRSHDFRLTVRDNDPNGGRTATDIMTATTTDAAGPFTVLSQATDGISWRQNTTEMIMWDVAGTDANGVNTANVNIWLSTDGGLTYTTPLIMNTPNDGSEMITVPNVAAPSCRIMIEAVGNIFFAINTTDFAVGYSALICTQYNSGTLGIAIPDGVGANMPGATVSNIINVPSSFTISDVNVNVDVSHTWVGDMVVQLIHPDGTTFNTLWGRECNTGDDNFDVIFDDGTGAIACNTPTTGTFDPTTPLNVFNGLVSAGNWTIIMADYFNGDTGTFNDWYIEICSQQELLSTTDLNANDLFSVFPNPNNGEFTVKLSSNTGNIISMDLYDMRGRIVYEEVVEGSSDFSKTLNLDSLQSGMYILNVSDGALSQNKKIIIE
ncbi:MAG: T9SS type A sorting domain-containing protein [Bacteroidia bacterium]|nr:T9SS type A sorting domain-containing protein [Bacteroidia bacterium]MBT8310778.1 T9SS type A sorting domain-containing protein [Bacteroidia bacterium]NND09943.1 T9SS type A sorting domain-containing protein [Flavobacteriaceae bacterium]NNK26844.1 T9SS type A sorting domain-containing protein [Flavobacteriaceae bacterium]RZV70906.1 MAG: T9SS type A sorting domain-containing protein [Flavobacteriaceae bacterium]